VNYTSRDENGVPVIMLRGWWLPALGSTGSSPRIVVQHGYTSNSNKFRTDLLAYMLRSMGFDVLLNNFRDHCYSDNTEHEFETWGYAYPEDLLGAWDFARNDPDGILGGALGPDKVGIAGFSKGGFMTANVFGMEGRIPAVWLDGPPATPKSVFINGLKHGLEGMGIGFLFPFVADQVWANMKADATAKGFDIDKNTPAKNLPKGPDTQRPLFLVYNTDDTTVPYTEGKQVLEVLHSSPEKYKVKGVLETSGICNVESHCIDHLRMPKEYGRLLCKFWSGVFGTSEDACGLSTLTTWKNPPGFEVAPDDDVSTNATTLYDPRRGRLGGSVGRGRKLITATGAACVAAAALMVAMAGRRHARTGAHPIEADQELLPSD
jgi:hypothetical protein